MNAFGRTCAPLAAALAIAGCSRDSVLPTAPGAAESAATRGASDAFASAAAQPGFYPLAIGNRWVYAGLDSFWVAYDGGPVVPGVSVASIRTVELTRSAVVGGREYVVQHEQTTYPAMPGVTITTDYLYRQDATGLYVADVLAPGSDVTMRPAARAFPGDLAPMGTPAAATLARLRARLAPIAHGGVIAGIAGAEDVPPTEARLLAYPLHTGASWDVRTDVRFVDTVEGPETLRLSFGTTHSWRLGEDTDYFGFPSDMVRLWYGAVGLVRLEAHLQGIYTDESGNRLGIAHVTQEEVLGQATFAPTSAASHRP